MILYHINNALAISEVQKKVVDIENVLACDIAGFNTKTPVITVIFSLVLDQSQKEKILERVREVLHECGLPDKEEVKEFSVFYEMRFKR